VKRFLVALGAGLAAAAVAVVASPLGQPAGLGAAWAAAGAESTLGGTCDHDGLATALQHSFVPTVGYMVAAVEVSGIDARCAGHHVSVALTDEFGAVSSESAEVLVPSGGGSVTVPVPPVRVTALARVHTLID
jgi:hypothetical protein